MNLIFVPSNSVVSSVEPKKLYFSDDYGGGYLFEKADLSTAYFEKNIFFGVCHYNSKAIKIFIKAGSSWKDRDVAESVIIEPEIAGLEPITKRMFVQKLKRNSESSLTILDYRFVDDKRKWFVTVYDSENNTYYEAAENTGLDVDFFEGELFNFDNCYIARCDKNLNEIWKYQKSEKPIESPRFINQYEQKKIINLKES